MKTVAQKMGVKENSSSHFVNAPNDALADIQFPEIKISKTLEGELDYIHLFVKSQDELREVFPKLKKHLQLNGMLWVSWPKNRQLDTDLTLPKVIEIGYSFGLVESINLSVNEVWSALKFTHPKKGKTYQNSHGTLQSRTTNR